MKLGSFKFDTTQYASRANTIVGIRDSGKSYTGTGIGEQLLDAGIPIIAMDPAGIWRFLRVAGKSKGYPIIVVGKDGADLPLNPDTVGSIVLAALQTGASLVFDLSEGVTKADMRVIVRKVVEVLMANNKKYGLRHVFVEEAAEFIPQKVRDGLLYEAVEKLVRIGGNMGLGVTLINPRTQNLNKEALELCENILLHRQLGKNSLGNLAGWFENVGIDDPKELMRDVAGLGEGECVVWLGGSSEPVKVKVQQKNSFHPNRRDTKASVAAWAKRVEVGKALEDIRAALPKVEEERKANDPAELKKQLSDLRGQLRKLEQAKPAAAPASAKTTREEETRIRSEGYNAGWAAYKKEHDKEIRDRNKIFATLKTGLEKLTITIPAPAEASVVQSAPVIQPTSARITVVNVRQPKPTDVSMAADLVEGLDGPQTRIMKSLGMWANLGFDTPTKAQVAVLANYGADSPSFRNALGALQTAGLITHGNGRAQLTDAGRRHKGAEANPIESVEDLHNFILGRLDGPQTRIFNALVPAGPNVEMSRADVAAGAQYGVDSPSFRNSLGALRTMEIVDYGKGTAFLRPWVFMEQA